MDGADRLSAGPGAEAVADRAPIRPP